jgi:hypothetical protein
LYVGIRTALGAPLIVERVEMDLPTIHHALSRPFRDAFHPLRRLAPTLPADAETGRKGAAPWSFLAAF